MQQALTIVMFIFFVGVIAPFLVTSACLFLEKQLESRRENLRALIFNTTDELILLNYYQISEGEEDAYNKAEETGRIGGESMISAVRSLVILQLCPRHLRFIRGEYGDCDRWVESRIRVFFQNCFQSV